MPNFLITGLKFDFDRFAQYTGISAQVLRDGTGLCLSSDTALLHDLAFPHLRYCPACSAEGFHSVLFQFPLFSRCPHHGVPLLDRCACGAVIDYRWPTATSRTFKCSRCDRRLWDPKQLRFTAHPGEKCFEDAVRWAAATVERTIRFANSGAPLRRWVQRADGERWARLGLPEISGVFTPRGLRRPLHGYWGGRRVLKTEPERAPFCAKRVYRSMLEVIGNRLRIPTEGFDRWLSSFQGMRSPAQGDLAFVVWRCFWESAHSTASLADGRDGESVESVLLAHFRTVLVPSGYPPADLAAANELVFQAVLEASFVFCYSIVQRTKNLSRVIQTLPETPLPVVLVKPAEGGLVVEWVHQREVGEVGAVMFGPRQN